MTTPREQVAQALVRKVTTPETLELKYHHAENCRRYQKGMLRTGPIDCTCYLGAHAGSWKADRDALAALLADYDKQAEQAAVDKDFITQYQRQVAKQAERVASMRERLMYFANIKGNFCAYPDKEIEHIGAEGIRYIAQKELAALAQEDK